MDQGYKREKLTSPLKSGNLTVLGKKTGIWRTVALSMAAGLILTVSQTQARINLVNLPGRDSVQLTIYNSADLTLVKETRVLTFKKGINRLEFSWANTLIDPTSVEFHAKTHAADVEVLDVSFPPRVTNTLEWRIQSEFAGEVEVQIRYFTSGITWTADYLAEVDAKEKLMNLAGTVKVTNKSGEDYENAQVRLVVGVIKLVETIKDLAQREDKGAVMVNGTLGALPALNKRNGQLVMEKLLEADSKAVVYQTMSIVKEELSEYFMYTVEGRDTIPNGWSKKLPSVDAENVPIVSFYKYEKEVWGNGLIRYYRFKNDKDSNLGKEPLPDGSVTAYRVDGDDKRYSFVGFAPAKYIPINEQVDLELGPDMELKVSPKLMNWQKMDIQFDAKGDVKGWSTKETWEIELQNSKEIDAVVDIRRNFEGDWSLETESKYEKVDATKVKFIVPLKSGEKRSIRYELTTRSGTNATR